MAYPKPRFTSDSTSERKLKELQGTLPVGPGQAPKACACPYCQGNAKRVRAINEDGATLVLGSFDMDAGLDIEYDDLAAYQCERCERFVYLTPLA